MILFGIFKNFGERERDVGLDVKYKFNFIVIIMVIIRKNYKFLEKYFKYLM